MKILVSNGQVTEGRFEDREGSQAFWHTTAHILAQAVKRLYPDAKCAIGPAVEKGFYYDFEFSQPFTENDLPGVEAEMKKIAKEALPLMVYEVTKEEALSYMKGQGESYKQELISQMEEGERLTFYGQGEYKEFCAGPHVTNTGAVKALKLTGVAGAYWRGNEKNKMLTRIYGISFPKAQELEQYLTMLEEAKRRDHRKLGKELGLFTIMEEGPGFPFFLPKGMVLKNILIDYWRRVHQREGYLEISTPVMLNRYLWELSGHWDHYRENMYTTVIDGEDFALKPMNCPGGMLVYKAEPHSYKELPMRIGELGLVHRHERSGQMHGLMRVRCFTQDDAHIFMMREQIQEEIKGVARLIDEVYSRFGFPYHVELSTRPENSIGSDEDWKIATDGLRNALEDLELPYTVNEGDGAFYGPKIDFHLQDSIGRTWQCGTIQLDFQLPARFEAEFTGADGEKHRPIMIHRVIYGSIERFIGILTEHYAGRFPVWLAPVQVKVLSVSEKNSRYAQQVCENLRKADIRCELDIRSEKLGYKIREARLQRVPYLVIVGEKEEETKLISVRNRDGEEGKQDLGQMTVEMLTERISRECTASGEAS
ncbi:MAG: threonine--tRNA ligase [Lachnospiraceae bacterium]|nr:threonine--tRNA ligase [Lachnospiraceae bacterium]